MTDFNKNMKMHAEHIRLTDAERRRILTALRAAHAPRATPSPFFVQPSLMRFGAVFAAIVIVISAGAGAAFASEDALPGDALYPVKVAVVEPALGALATTPEEKAAWNADVAATRLDEASALAKKGELTASTSAELAANFNEHASALSSGDARFATLATKAGNVLAAGKESGSASSTIESGRLVLAIALTRPNTALHAAMKTAAPSVMSAPEQGFAPEQTEPAETDEEARPVTLMAPMMMKASFAPAPQDDDTLAETLSVEAHGALDDATTTAALLASSTPLSDDIVSRLSDLSALVVTAEAERSVGSTTEAIRDFTESLRRAAELNLILHGDTSSDVNEEDASSSEPLPSETYPI